MLLGPNFTFCYCDLQHLIGNETWDFFLRTWLPGKMTFNLGVIKNYLLMLVIKTHYEKLFNCESDLIWSEYMVIINYNHALNLRNFFF